ncbi:hypothetical protein Val02_58860 [Virgisporangium aliadipatigenens]|uniref:YbaB/EbfC family DNA-binding protein n=1 Tax=Virgisporangium aliadipatigenens TaxID=741659 RepID=A0A8J4DSA1_9ACTN|nr:YbaB/EbfC family nucleoid-associated protein [Virgisporangium aliadipatigenens]GIJ49000.1 hypothetical protein Val02_58860 [Virgisporangium aliadipatigenens]
MPPELDQARLLLEAMERIRAGHYAGSDPAGLVRVTVDGDGMVSAVRFRDTVGRYDPRAVEVAVRMAVTSAQDALAAAYSGIAEPMEDGT